jgi:endonuclease III-like uncharacterized protein
MSNIDDYIAAGGKVTHCPAIERKATIKRKYIPKKIDDELCKDCPNNQQGKKKKAVCKGLCPPMRWINGNTQTKEVLMSSIRSQELEFKDYNKDLAELIEDRQWKLDKSLSLEDTKQRAIAILLMAGFKQNQIKTLFFMSYRQINRIANKIKS